MAKRRQKHLVALDRPFRFFRRGNTLHLRVGPFWLMIAYGRQHG